MDDLQIVRLYWERSQDAISETASKYEAYLERISYQILYCKEDSQECVNDTYEEAWDSMPPHQPTILATFLGKITRRISIDRWRSQHAAKRGGGEIPLALEELGECVSGYASVEGEIQRRELIQLLQTFLNNLPTIQRDIFLCRYWYLKPVKTIAGEFGFSETKVSSMLYHMRKKLRTYLEKEGY